MADSSWSNPWKLTAVGMALVAVIAVVTGLVVANRSGDPKAAATSSAPVGTTPAPVAKYSAPVARAAKPQPAVPTQAAVTACNQYAASQVGERNKTTEIGSLYGLNENRKHDQRYRDTYASCMRDRGYTG
jgi:hypothetical protein